jgi:solute carrier family 25 carnitine/acylcarnitine transporter 20/29
MSEAYAAGFVSGMAQTLVGHPFDTLKVWAQNGQAIRSISVSRLYAGLSYPLLASGFLNSISFGVANSTTQHGHIVSGAIAGAVSGMLTAPIDYYKVRAQARAQEQRTSGGSRASTSGRASTSRASRASRISNMAIGTTVLRDSLGYGIYFPVYYALKDQVGCFSAGGMAGIASWTLTYPLDTIKTRIQAGNMQYGNLWHGYLPCVVRAWFVNAVGWMAYEKMMGLVK